MSEAHVSQGTMQLTMGDEQLSVPLNVIPNPAIRTYMFNMFVYNGQTPALSNWQYWKQFACPGFNRFSNLRYYKDKNYLDSIYYRMYTDDSAYQVWIDPYFANGYKNPQNMIWYQGTTPVLLASPSMAVGSVNNRNILNPGWSTVGEYPTGKNGYPLLTSIDVPGTTVGNLFKHPIGRSANFNEVGQIALSQGAVAFIGVYNPPESLAYSATYQIYYTKSGGTGIVVGGVKTTGETFPGGTNNYTFKDTTFAGFVPGDADGNHYVAIRSGANIGTFKITAYVDANTVETDAATINQPFSNATGLTWTMRTGPIGEYFFRRRRYSSGDTWVTGPYYQPAYGGLGLSYMNARTVNIDGTILCRPNIVSIHDRGVCRWMLADHGQAGASYAPYGLQRWVEQSNSGLDYPYLDSDITNMPAGIRYWRDMDIDNTTRNKLWIATDDYTGGNTGYSVFKVDPYPSGNARYPDCVAKYSKQTNAADAAGLPSSNARGVCCDVFNDRTWILFGADGTSSGGLAYTEDGGTTWSRMHKLSALTGTLAVKATGSTTAIAGNLYWDGHKIVIGDGHPSTPHTVTFSFTGGQGAVSLVSVADNGSGKARITLNQWTAYPIGSAVIISGSTYYNGTWDVLTKIDDNIWDIDVAYTATDTGSVAWQPAGGWDAADVEIAVLNSDTAAQVGNKIRPIINGATLFVTAGGTNDSLPLTNDDYGIGGNVTITTTTGMSVSGMSGGSGWTVAGDGVTVNNPLADSAFTTELAVGDWITMTGVTTGLKKRKIASITDNNTLVLAASTTFGAAMTGPEGLPGTPGSNVKGVLTDAQCRLYFSNASADDGYVHPPCDYDTDGRLYWISDAATGILRVDVSTTVPEAITNAQLSGTQTFDSPRSLTVTKFVDVAGSGTGTFQNNVWVGSYDKEMTRVYSWSGPLSITRYHHLVSNAFPTTVQVPLSATHYYMRAIQDLKSGYILIVEESNTSAYRPDAYILYSQHKSTHASFGLLSRFGSSFQYLLSDSPVGWGKLAWTTWNFDDIGLSSCLLAEIPTASYPASSLQASLGKGGWTCFRWNGTSWQTGFVNCYNPDMDFDNSTGFGPFTDGPYACGAGAKRALEVATPLDNGLYLQFNQAGGGTLQPNEFIADENTTMTASIGRVKDNTMTASYYIDIHALPSIVRLDEPIVNAESFWTSDDGFDGGYVDNATDTSMPVYMRGVAEYCSGNASGTTNYPTMTHVLNAPNNPHYMIARRVHETTFDAGDLDISTVLGVGYATCPTGTYTFSSADINKTLRVHGAATGGNNTSKLITAVNTGTNTVTLSSAWAADELGRKWTLRLIPAVGYVVLNYHLTDASYESFLYQNYKLHSSKDAGVNWDAVKSTKYFSGVAANDPITKVGGVGYIDAGVFVDCFSLNSPMGHFGGSHESSARSVVFDIRELSEEARRRTHWKIHRENVSSQGGYNAYPASVILLDENYVPMGTASLFLTDRNDPKFVTADYGPTTVKAVVFDSSTAGVGIDMGYGYAFTDILQAASESFWEQNNTDLIAFANTTRVKSTAATFSIASVGKKLRIPSLGISGTYDGFSTIDTFVDANTVLISRTILSQATGSITGVTNNAGQAVFASASHTLVNGDAVTITSTTSYNGQWIAVNVVAGVSFELGLAYVASETGTWNKGQTGLTWALTNIAPTDKVRFDDTTTFYRHLGRPLAVATYEVLDVPTNTRIQTKYKDLPVATLGAFVVERAFTNAVDAWSQVASWDTTFSAGFNSRLGCFVASDSAVFNTIQEDSATETATSSADDDGDGWTNEITLTGITLSAQAAANDWILLYKTTGTMYRRWYKIKSITGYGPGAVIKTYEDELIPSTTFKWKVCRKRTMKMRVPAVSVVGSSQMT